MFILLSSWNLAKDTISPLIGEAASPELESDITDILKSNPMILNYHDLMVHDYGPGKRFASVHVEMDRREDPLVCHELIDNLERLCHEKLKVHLVIHYDPVTVDDAVLNLYRSDVTEILSEKDDRLMIHDFRMVESDGHTNLIFDIALPYNLKGSEKEIKTLLETKMEEKYGKKFYTVITFDPAAFNRQG